MFNATEQDPCREYGRNIYRVHLEGETGQESKTTAQERIDGMYAVTAEVIQKRWNRTR